jgi:hypothetical protein
MGVRFVGVRIEATAASSLDDVLLPMGVCAPAGFAVGSLEADFGASAAGFSGVFTTGSGSSRTEGRSSSCGCSCSDCAVSQLSFDPALTALSGVGAGYGNEVSPRRRTCKQTPEQEESNEHDTYLLEPR